MAESKTNENDILRGMSMIEKVARFFVLIGEESTVKIFQHLPKEVVENIYRTMINSFIKLEMKEFEKLK